MASAAITTVGHPAATPYQLDLRQTTQACKVLLKHIAEEHDRREKEAAKPNLLQADNDSDEESQDVDTPVWLVLTTKKHIVDKKRLKPSKIPLPNPINTSPTSKICLITASPSTTYTSLISSPAFPSHLAPRVHCLDISKLKTKYSQYEARRQLLAEYDIFLADDRIVTSLPKLLGKVFYKGGSKRPIPVCIMGAVERGEDGKRLKKDPADSLKAKENRTALTRGAVTPEAVAKEIEKSLNSALVHLAPAATTSVKVGRAGMTAEEVCANVSAVVNGLTEKFVAKGWRGVRAVHVKGPNTMAFPVWLANELWVDEEDVKEIKPAMGKKKTKGALTAGAAGEVKTIEGVKEGEAVVDSPVGKKRKADSTSTTKETGEGAKKKKRKAEANGQSAKDTAQRKERLRKQKQDALSEVQ